MSRGVGLQFTAAVTKDIKHASLSARPSDFDANWSWSWMVHSCTAADAI